MGDVISTAAPAPDDEPVKPEIVSNMELARSYSNLMNNQMLYRSELLKKLLDPKCRDMDKECGYPERISIDMYRDMYDREGVGTRVVAIYPKECWKLKPELYEDEDEDTETEFEKEWKRLNKKHNFWHYLHRIDELSGIGHYGVLFLGLNDGKDLSEPVDGVQADGTIVNEFGKHELTFIRALDAKLAVIAAYETDDKSPRYGQPKMYNIQLIDPSLSEGGFSSGVGQDIKQTKVHWSRCVHIADNRKSSEIFGVPRMRPVWNYLLNIRKLLGGSAEMYWRGGFPGLSFETYPELTMAGGSIDKDALKKEIEAYSNGMKRYMALEGMSAKTLAPNIADPEKQLAAQFNAIAICIDVPLRVFMGSEQAQLASGQDKGTWNDRVTGRNEDYTTPWVITPFVERLMGLGCLPLVEEFHADWPDLNTPGDKDRALITFQRTQALSAYVAGGCDVVMAPLEYLTKEMGFSQDEAQAILDASLQHIEETNDPEDPRNPMQMNPLLDPANPNNPANPDHPANNPPPGQSPGAGE